MISPLLHVQTDNPFEDISTKYLEFTVQMNFGTELEVGDRLVPDLRAGEYVEDVEDWWELTEPLWTNGWNQIDPSVIGALTGNHTLISDWTFEGPEYEPIPVERVFYYPNYQISSPVEELKERGEIELDVVYLHEEEPVS